MGRRKRDEATKDIFAYADDNLSETIVYMATNSTNGFRYIGITRQSLPKRQAQHHCPTSRQTKFSRAIKRYGRDAFSWLVLASFPTYKDAAREEIRLISLMSPEYNRSPGGDGIDGIGARATKATRKKLSLSHMGKPGFWTGKKRSVESIEKRTATRALNPVRPWLGKKRDAATIEKIAKKKRKWVVCLDDGKTYHGLKQAAEAYAIPRHREIAHVCSGRAKSIRGLRFTYVEAAA